MHDDIREQVALARFKIISPILAEPSRVQNRYFSTQAQQFHDLPHYGRKRFSISTFKLWLKAYKEHGFEGLKPKPRVDQGRPRRLGPKELDAIRAKCKAFPDWSVRLLHKALRGDRQLGHPPVTYQTLLRIIRQEKLLESPGRTDTRKRFEMPQVNELWVGDFMHGPQVQVGKKTAKAILCAIIDDHTRMIVGHHWYPNETIMSLAEVLKEAFLSHGLPLRLYLDNGSAFRSDLLVKACASARISLIHSKPYDSPSRGKIERFFRTIRQRFLPHVQGILTIDELNELLTTWLREQYHHAHHAGIGGRPIDRYHSSVAKADIRRLSRRELDEIFLVRQERTVNNDATISFKNRIYEVPGAYIRQKVELRHPVGKDEELFLYDNGVRVARITQVDVKHNARTFKPKRPETTMSFSDNEVTE